MSGTNLSEDKPLQQHLKPHRGEPETPSKTLKTASSVVFFACYSGCDWPYSLSSAGYGVPESEVHLGF